MNNSSNKTPETLDYIIIPTQYKFKSISCNMDGLSDHRPVLVEIELPE